MRVVVMTIKEAAANVDGAEQTVHALAQTSEISAVDIHEQRRFERAELDSWIASRPRGGNGGSGGE
jgi:excisionase family DNA binding protein